MTGDLNQEASQVIRFITPALMLGLASFSVPTRADVLLSATERGWVCTPLCNGVGTGFNNGADPGNNYIAGKPSAEFRDWFEFAIPSFSGALTSATLELYEPGNPPDLANGHSGGTLTYSVYGLSAQPTVFSGVGTANPFGSVSTSSTDDGTIIDITLNAAALAAITSDQGGNIFIGGIDSGETAGGYDFGTTGVAGETDNTTDLSLVTSASTSVPEPSAVLLLAPAAGWIAWRRLRRQSH